jgi:hypothetical protein
MILTGAPSYEINVPGLGPVTYARGEDVPQRHVNEVPEADRALFEQPAAEYPPFGGGTGDDEDASGEDDGGDENDDGGDS